MLRGDGGCGDNGRGRHCGDNGRGGDCGDDGGGGVDDGRDVDSLYFWIRYRRKSFA